MKLFLRVFRYIRPYRVRFAEAIGCSVLVAGFTLAYAKLVEPMVGKVLMNQDKTWLLLVGSWSTAGAALPARADTLKAAIISGPCPTKSLSHGWS